MSTLPLDIRRQAKSLVEAGKTSDEVGALLDISKRCTEVPLNDTVNSDGIV
jgi:hypothetical protein